jgi:hypothetical protein
MSEEPPEEEIPPSLRPPTPPERQGDFLEAALIRFLRRALQIVIGPARGLSDPRLFHKISLAAVLAWVGLGADGLSSSAYGPEAGFLALGPNIFLAIPLALVTASTVMIIAASYSRIIERFPAGGGGYVVSTKLLGQGAGLASGCALLVDYVLTVAISLASCSESLFSLIPPSYQSWRLPFTFGLLGVLTVMNLRGVKESVTLVTPIFLIFLVSHVGALAIAVVSRAGQIPAEIHQLKEQSSLALQQAGWVPLLILLFRAFTLGGGTYTGIEAVSNGVPILREPKVKTARTTMAYMAISLAVVAGGILFAYLLYQVHSVPGRTLNAVLWSAVFGQLLPPGSHWVELLTAITVSSAGALLLIAAQTGYLDGPRVLANMALDRWVPSRFANLSERLVSANGIWLITVASFVVLWATRGLVQTLVVLYSINVFLTFSLSQLGMCRDALHLRWEGKPWLGPLILSGTGFLVTTSLLVGTVSFKFAEGGWATLLVTALFCIACLGIRRHYVRTAQSLERLDDTLTTIPLPSGKATVAPMQRNVQTAILTVTNFGGVGIHSLLNQSRLFPNLFKQIAFVSVGAIDSGRFKGADEIGALRRSTEAELQKYVDFARKLGIPAESRYSIGTDIVDELEALSLKASEDYPRSVTFGGQLVFQKEGTLVRWLHNQTCPALQRRLAFHGLPMIILPIRIY